jgi:hypothetical protein
LSIAITIGVDPIPTTMDYLLMLPECRHKETITQCYNLG